MEKNSNLHQVQFPVQDSDSFSQIELTEEEKTEILAKALKEKQTRAREADYWQRVKNPPPLPVFDKDSLLVYVVKRWENTFNQHFIKDAQVLNQIELLSMYFTGDARFEENGLSLKKGLLLMGGTGVGKTTLMQLFAKNPICSYRIVECREIANDYATNGANVIDNYIEDIHPSHQNPFRQDAWGLCFDDLGTESMRKNFGNEANIMEEIILSRYSRRNALINKTHITTNLTGNDIEERYGARVRSRMREMFNVIEFVDAKDMRK